MLYRIQTRLIGNQFDLFSGKLISKQEDKLLDVWLEIMEKWDGLKGPIKVHNKARHYFTELGWKMFGLPFLAAAKQNNLVVKVIKIKNPKKSRIFYQDKYQVQLFH